MNWSREIPSQSGYYWYRGPHGPEPCEIAISAPPDQVPLMMFISDETVHVAGDVPGEWCGPLIPPA